MNETFKEYLQNQNLSQNTIISYTSTLEQYHNQFHTFTRKNLREYKYFLMENYKPQTVNLRIRAINCYLESIHKEQWKLSGVKVQQKPFLENVISEADYLYFKNCLKQDQEMYWYFVVRFLAATGARVTELTQMKVEHVRMDIWIFIQREENCAESIFLQDFKKKPCSGFLKKTDKVVLFFSINMGTYYIQGNCRTAEAFCCPVRPGSLCSLSPFLSPPLCKKFSGTI